MKVLMILKRFHPSTLYGGAERSAYRLAFGLTARGTVVDIIGARVSKGWEKTGRIDTGAGTIRVSRIPHPSIRFFGTLAYNIHLLFAILGRRRMTDVVHVHFASFEMMTAAMARMLGGPPVLCKIACSGESGEIHLARKRFYYPVFRSLMKKVGIFVALSSEIADELEATGIGSDHISQIPNGIDPSRFRPPTASEREDARKRFGLAPSEKCVLFTGRLSKQKNLDLLLKAMPDPSEDPWRLLVAGKGPEDQLLRSMAERLDIDRHVEFLGPIDDTLPLYHAADIFVLPSRDEGLSNSLLEAMSTGLRVIASNISGSKEAIEDGISGILVPPGDLPALAAALSRTLASPASRTGIAARERVLEKYSIDTVCDLYTGAYRDLSHAPETIDVKVHARPLFLINSYPPRIGGAERLVESLAAEFSRSGVKCLIVTRWNGGTGFVYREGRATVVRVPVFGGVAVRSLIFRTASVIIMIALRGRYDVIHAHSLDSPAVIGRFVSGLIGKKLYITIHNTGKVAALLDRMNGSGTLSRLITASDSFISINSSINQDLLQAGCPGDRIVSIANGVDTERFCPLSDDERYRGRMKMGHLGRTIFLFVGNFHDQKGIDTLLEAWSILMRDHVDSGAILFLVGDGVLLPSMKGMSARLDLGDSVRFLGRRSDVRDYLRLSDVFVQPSRWEGLSIALLEAMACRLPVIATPVGGSTEVIEDGSTGLFVPVDDPVALAAAMGRMLEDSIFRDSCGEKGRAVAESKYSIKKCAERHMELFDGKFTEGEIEDDNGITEESGATADERDEQASKQETEELSRQLS